MVRSFAQRFRCTAALAAALTLTLLLCQTSTTYAGTTGGLSGTVTDVSSKQPIAGVKITVASPSQIASTTSDAGGHFQFLNLTPDTYTVSAELQGYGVTPLSGITIVADNTRVLPITAQKEIRTIARVTARSAASLVQAGTTADVYSINATQQAKVAAAGGGANLDSAFSALSTVAGVAVQPGQAGYIGAAAELSIRGGDFDQIGYELDGLPINRSFDNYPSGATSSLGQQELQVYTGAPPPTTASDGLSGYINQVIKTGTNPGYVTSSIGDGSPYYHKFDFEFAGISPNNRLSYYVGLGGYDQAQRFVDQYDGASLAASYGLPYGVSCGVAGTYSKVVAPSCYSNGAYTPQGYVLLPSTAFAQSQVADRDSIFNLHYFFPHKDGSRDDIQLLFDNSALSTQYYSSANDLGGIGFEQNINVANGGTLAGNSNFNPANPGFLINGQPNTATYIDGYQLNLPTGGFLPANYRQYASIYSFPNVPAHPFDGQINPALRDGFNNDQAIVKLQFTKSIGSAAFFRLYGFSNYSDWLNTGPNSAYIPNGEVNGDYELESHQRGAGFQFSDQLNSQNLLTIDGDYTKATVVRDNNTENYNGEDPDVDSRTAIGVLVNGKSPTSGVCYSPTGAAVNCLSSPTDYNTAAQYATVQQAYTGTIAPITAKSCGNGPCQYLVIGNGQYATYNSLTPQFFGASINDQLRPTDKLTVNLGLRLDDYQFIGGDTSGGNARAFWYNAYNNEVCESAADQSLTVRPAVGAPCPAGTSAVNFTNPGGNVTETYPEFQPRFGLTYALSPRTVLRAAYGRYTQPPNTAFEQYDALQSNAPALLYGTYGFQQYGFTTPNHPVPPAASNNLDFSLEQSFSGQLSLKLSPFLRSTQNQTELFYLDRATAFSSGLNVGNQTSRGIEFELDKGDFARDGLSAKLSFAYTNSYVRYNTLSNGSTVLTPIVDAINTYNSFTKRGGGARCYTAAVYNTSGTQTGGGVPDPACAAGDIANPYYNAPLQDPNAFNGSGTYTPYTTIPAGIGVSAIQLGYPYVTSLVLNEKIKRIAITPIVKYFAGQRYGSPLATEGIDPTTCGGTLAASSTGDPRYQFGAAGGSPFDASTCGQLLGGIPNPQTGTFDGLGAFVEPSQLLLHFQMSYEVSRTLTLTANLANVVNTCFGGSNVPWRVSGACGYGNDEAGATAATSGPSGSSITGGIGNTYNPGDGIQPGMRYAYSPYWLQQPFGVYVNANVKL
ncbi:MAG: TonB-dependent receptor [Candidatus Eremiobacteraeota bacterium]|nr:TonB-dependent receptor [Candidatus Eremiobacteraeota bacterium]